MENFRLIPTGTGTRGVGINKKSKDSSRSDWERGEQRREPIGWIKALPPDGEGRYGGGSRASKKACMAGSEGAQLLEDARYGGTNHRSCRRNKPRRGSGQDTGSPIGGTNNGVN
ncbi:hypothetical protein RHMOL_Rhmol06G0033400 [Rhododendron molle]|uniref:Uncharacterized protein n=1 Tax=Rhododendron molle TaxID=49168 RepID=A0ACC0N8H2_RHOML|nr:hypothetical protein RHMOL_Rhmol06G0033400 [Rhododendron molle]